MLNPIDPFASPLSSLFPSLTFFSETLRSLGFKEFYGQKDKLENYLSQKDLGYVAYLLDDYLKKLSDRLIPRTGSLQTGVLPEYSYPEVAKVLIREHQRREEERRRIARRKGA